MKDNYKVGNGAAQIVQPVNSNPNKANVSVIKGTDLRTKGGKK